MDASCQQLFISLEDLLGQLKDGQRVVWDAQIEKAIASDNVMALRDRILDLCKQYNESYDFIMALSKGDLQVVAPKRNSFVNPYKQLQAELLHLTWQIKEIAEGDFEQKVSFSGDFSDSINKMIESLRETRRISELNKHYLEELQKLNATKDKFFSIIAHDLKNPFSGLLTVSDLLIEDIHQMKYENLEDFAGIIRSFSEQGYKLLVNLLDWAMVQTSVMEMNIKPLLLHDLVQDSKAIVEPSALKKKISLTCECSDQLMVMADSNMLHTVLRNLLTNAVKYTPEGGQVHLECLISGNNAVVSVQDNGVGIKTEHIADLFRIDVNFSTPGTNNEQGTGLGLVLSNDLMNKMNGTIWVDSECGKGTTFRISLPLAL
jgi:signal transduction histidine kinase